MKKPILNTILCAIASLTLFFCSMSNGLADLIVYEGFDHPAATIGDLDGLSGGTDYPDYGWAGGWIHNFMSGDDASGISAGSLSWTGVVSHGNKLNIYRDATRSLIQTVGGTSGTVWCGAMFYATNAKRTAYFRLFSGTTKNLEINSYRKDNTDLLNVKLDAVDTGVDAKNSTQFFLLRIDFQPTGNVVYLWVDPDVSSEPDTSTAHATKTYATNWTFNKVGVANSSAISQSSLFDEIRIGTTFQDVLKPIGPPDGTVIIVQ